MSTLAPFDLEAEHEVFATLGVRAYDSVVVGLIREEQIDVPGVLGGAAAVLPIRAVARQGGGGSADEVRSAFDGDFVVFSAER